MRSVFNSLSTRLVACLFAKLENKKGFTSLASNQFINKTKEINFTSLLPQASNKPFFESVAKFCDDSFLYPKTYPAVQKISTVIKYNMKNGKKNTVKEVPEKFFRLHWGGWIRTVAKRHRKIWKKNAKKRNRALQHVLCSSSQCRMLDKMVAKEWKVPRYYIEDPYAPYHSREEFIITRKKPWRPDGVDYE